MENQNFITIIQEYNDKYKGQDGHIEHCKNQSNLGAAIEIAAKAVDNRNKRHMHQSLIKKLDLENFAEKLKIKEQEIQEAKSFDEIMTIVTSINSIGIGELTKYDTATRIGFYLGLNPDKIYLHSGTREGAKNLLGRLNGKKYLLLEELPSEFSKYLSASDIENLLCNFKDDLKNLCQTISM